MSLVKVLDDLSVRIAALTDEDVVTDAEDSVTEIRHLCQIVTQIPEEKFKGVGMDIPLDALRTQLIKFAESAGAIVPAYLKREPGHF